MIDKFPYICPDHPTAQIRHVWDQTHFVIGGFPAGTGTKNNEHFYCAECGRELSAKEAIQNIKEI